MYAHTIHRNNTTKIKRSATIPRDQVRKNKQKSYRYSLPVPLPASVSLVPLIIGTQRRPIYTYAVYTMIPEVNTTTNFRPIHFSWLYVRFSHFSCVAVCACTPQHFPWVIIIRNRGQSLTTQVLSTATRKQHWHGIVIRNPGPTMS